MASNFLSKIGSFFEKAAFAGDNTARSLDGDNGEFFGSLGEIANRIDKTARRSYIENGYIRNSRPRSMSILMQQPEITILIKKRMFSSLVNNYRADLMSQEEKTFYKASKILFKNKCNAIAAYEKLSKIEKVVTNKGILDEFMVPPLLQGVEALDALGVDIIDGKTRTVLDTLKKLTLLSEPNQFTTWITDKELPFAGELGEGTGVMEFTMVSGFSTNVSTSFGSSSASLTFEDPYRLMVITDIDIDRAIADAVNLYKNNNFFKFAEAELRKAIEDLKTRINESRVSRGVSKLTFTISPETRIYKKVRVVIDETGQELIYNYTPGFIGDVDIDTSVSFGAHALTTGESNLVKTLIKDMYKMLDQKRIFDKELEDFNSTPEIQYVREKMRLHFCNKSIIQPMDTVNIFVGSKSRLDDRVSSLTKSSLSGGSLLSDINNKIGDIKGAFNDIKTFFGGNKEGNEVEIEKNAIVGPDFPNWLWLMLKNDFTKQSAGVHVFAGLVGGDVTQSYNADSGKHTQSVDIKDNSYYFEISQINKNPSIEVFNSALYDPLTPFDLDFDASSGFLEGQSIPKLLPENETLLNSATLVFKNGRNRGAKASLVLYGSGDGEKVVATPPKDFRKIYNDPDGFVYRWKSGIGSLTTFNSSHPRSSLEVESSPTLTENPYAGQDAMNVLSLLITGVPYNYNTFIKAGIESSNLSRDDFINEDGSISFLRGLIGDISKNNVIWGNFIPFKKETLNSSALNFLISGQVDATTANKNINRLLAERAALYDTVIAGPDGALYAKDANLYRLGATGALEGSSLETNPLAADISNNLKNIDAQIKEQLDVLYSSFKDKNLQSNIRMFGDDISIDPLISGVGGDVSEEDARRQRLEFRKKLNSLTLRRLWKVKANEDKNYFIVDDQYDKNYDLLAFERALSGKMELLNSAYKTIKENIQEVGTLLLFEIYADTQGHIQARPQGWNKIPSSVFKQLIQRKRETGQRLYPKLLENLFVSQVEGLVERIEIIEDQIRLRTISAGFVTDAEAQVFLNGSEVFQAGTAFSFTTNSDGSFGLSDIRQAFAQTDPDNGPEDRNNALTVLNKKIKQASSSILFDTYSKVSFFENSKSFNIEAREKNKSTLDSALSLVKGRLARRGVNDNTSDLDILPGSPFFKRINQTRLLKISNDLSRLISERQGLLKTLKNAVKNLQDDVSIEDGNGLKAITYPELYGDIPETLIHLIEDEEVDDLGPGSGSRYVIKEHQIQSLTIKESAPEYTMTQVSGLYGEGFVEGPTNLNIGAGGNAITTAFAADYDMWRMYGFRASQAFRAPFLTSPETQCAPYAVYLLNLARKNILKATLTITGNEYAQPGEVIYIEGNDLLFYVESVSHSFGYSGDFTTTYTLTYGHNPGEYIPTHLDLIGKSLYSKHHSANLVRHQRHGHAGGDTPLTTIFQDSAPINFGSNNPLANITAGKYGEHNRNNMAKIILALTGALNPSPNRKLIVELRHYYDSKSNIFQNSQVLNAAQAIKTWILSPQSKSTENIGELLPEVNLPEGVNIEDIDDLIRIVSIDISQDGKSPSQEAWGLARIAANSRLLPDQTSLDNTAQVLIYEHIIDVWVRLERIESSVETSKKPSNINSEAQNSADALIDRLFFKR